VTTASLLRQKLSQRTTLDPLERQIVEAVRVLESRTLIRAEIEKLPDILMMQGLSCLYFRSESPRSVKLLFGITLPRDDFECNGDSGSINSLVDLGTHAGVRMQ
jgi:hypothetical protein